MSNAAGKRFKDLDALERNLVACRIPSWIVRPRGVTMHIGHIRQLFERLIVSFDYFIIRDLFLGEVALHPRSPANISSFSFLNLTQLDLRVELPEESIEIWDSALP